MRRPGRPGPRSRAAALASAVVAALVAAAAWSGGTAARGARDAPGQVETPTAPVPVTAATGPVTVTLTATTTPTVTATSSVTVTVGASPSSTGAGPDDTATAGATVDPTAPFPTPDAGRRQAFLPYLALGETLPGRDRIVDLVVRRTMAMTGTIELWDWEGGVAMVGLMHAYEATGDETILDHVEWWMAERIREGTPLTSPAWRDPSCATGGWPAEGVRHPNQMAPAWAALMLHQHRPRQAYLDQVNAAVDLAMRGACRGDGALLHLPGQIWDDTLAMAAPLLARAAATLDRPELADAAADEVIAHAAALQDDDGLWFHGWSALTRDHMSGGRWARGNGWAALATSDVLAHLPRDHPDRRILESVLARQLVALADRQDPSGLWHTLVDRPDFYLETSGSTAIAAAMLDARLPDGPRLDRLRRAGRLARGAAFEKVAPDGTVLGVSVGTGVAPDLEVYGRVPADRIQPYGQGLWLIMAAAGTHSPLAPSTVGP